MSAQIASTRKPVQPLIDWREQRDLSQRSIAKKLGITQSALSLIERGERTPRVPLAKKMAKLTKLPASVFLGVG